MAPTTRAGVVIQDETAKFKQFCMGKVKGAAQRTASVALKGGATGVMLVGKGGLGGTGLAERERPEHCAPAPAVL
jgi:hypothetical protein